MLPVGQKDLVINSVTFTFRTGSRTVKFTKLPLSQGSAAVGIRNKTIRFIHYTNLLLQFITKYRSERFVTRSAAVAEKEPIVRRCLE